MKNDYHRIEDMVQVFVAKPVSIALYVAWLAGKHLALAMVRLGAWLRSSQTVEGRQA